MAETGRIIPDDQPVSSRPVMNMATLVPITDNRMPTMAMALAIVRVYLRLNLSAVQPEKRVPTAWPAL